MVLAPIPAGCLGFRIHHAVGKMWFFSLTIRFWGWAFFFPFFIDWFLHIPVESQLDPSWIPVAGGRISTHESYTLWRFDSGLKRIFWEGGGAEFWKAPTKTVTNCNHQKSAKHPRFFQGFWLTQCGKTTWRNWKNIHMKDLYGCMDVLRFLAGNWKGWLRIPIDGSNFETMHS